MKSIGAFEFHEETENEKLFNSIRKYLSRYETDNSREDMIYHSLVDLLLDNEKHFLWDLIDDSLSGNYFVLRELSKKLQKECDFIFNKEEKKKKHIKDNTMFVEWDKTQTKRFGKILYRVSTKPESYIAIKVGNDGFFLKENDFEKLCDDVGLDINDFNEKQFNQLWTELFINDEKILAQYRRKYPSLKPFKESFNIENGIDRYEQKENETRVFKIGDKPQRIKREMDKQFKKEDFISFGGGEESKIDIDTKLINQDRYGNN